jgi:hypothetical protein
VVFVQTQYLAAGPGTSEASEQPRIRPVPPIDRLVGVTYHTKIDRRPQPGSQKTVLQRVHVLELVDEEVPPPPVLRRRELSVSFDGVGAL